MASRIVIDWPGLPCNGSIHVWMCAGVTSPACDEHLHRLSPDEQERAGKFRFDPDRRRYAGARLLLRQVLSHYLGCEGGEIAFRLNQWGKPALAGPGEAKLHFSLSRSAEVALLGVSSSGELGADVERCRIERSDAAIVRRQFSAPEQKFVNGASDRSAAFYEIWARKEAYIKGLGFGLSHPLATFNVAPDSESESASAVTTVQDWSENKPGCDWQVRTIRLPLDGYAAAVAATTIPEEIELIPLTLEELLERFGKSD